MNITGSRLKQIDLEAASPVQVIRRDDIRRSGVASMQELLDNLTASSAGTPTDISANNSFAPGASQASLRNLGTQATLVLLNGRRLPTFPLPDFQVTFPNVDTIPLDAVDRVEVLKVGGSAVYGSDAIAGVINIITRTSYQGISVNASDEASLQNGRFGQRTASLSAGVGNLDKDGYNLFGTLEGFQRDPVYWNGKVLDSVNPAYKAKSSEFGTPSTYSFPGNLDGQAILPGCSGPLSDSGECGYDRYQRLQAVPAAKRLNAMLAGDVRLGSNLQWHSELLASDIRVRYVNEHQAYGPRQPVTAWLDMATGAPKTFYERGLPVTHPLNTTGEDENTNDFEYRFADSGAGETTHTTSFRFLTGLKGDLGTWSYDVAVGAMGGHTRDRSRGQFSESGFTQVIGDPGHLVTDPADAGAGSLSPVAADFFDVPGGYRIGGPNSASVLNTLFPQYGFDGTYRQYFIDGNANATLMELPAGPLQVSVGAEARHESMVLAPTTNLVQSDIVGYSLSQSDGSRTYEAAYSEVAVPILKTMTASLAARVDKFPHVAPHVSPRVNFEFRPVDMLKLRGTLETGFRAPNLQESAPSSKSAYQSGVMDPRRCPAATEIANALRADAQANPQNADDDLRRAQQVVNNECSGAVALIAQNNPALKPETSLSKSLGAVWQVHRRWSVAADYWNIERKNEINLKSVTDLLATGDSAAVTRLPTNPDGTVNAVTDPTFTQQQIDQYGITTPAVASVRLQYENRFKTRTSGVDLGITGAMDTPLGEWTSTLEGTYTANWQAYSQARNASGGWGDNLAGRYGLPRWTTTLTNSLAVGDWQHTVIWRHRSGTSLQGDFNDPTFTGDDCANQGLTDGQCRVNAYNRFDYSVAYTGIRNLTLGAFVQNVLGRRPPVDYRAFGGAGGTVPFDTEDAARRLLKVSLNYKFM